MAKLVALYEYTDAELLALYREALAAIATGQSYTIRGKALTRADLSEVREMIAWLEKRVAATTTSGIAVAHGRHARRL
jgi:hypothetical protein